MKLLRPPVLSSALSLAVLATLPVAAYVLPVPALLDQIQQRREQTVSLPTIFEGSLAIIDEDGQRRVVAAMRSVSPEGRCRLEVVDGAAAELENAFVVWDGARVRDSGHHRMRALVLLESIACPLFAGGSHASTRLDQLIERLGVDRGYTGLSRLDGRVAFLIGARHWEIDKPQVWLDKDTLVPVRAIGDFDGVVADVRLLTYGDPVTGEWHPRVIQIFIDGELAAYFTTEGVDTDVDLAASLFR